MPKKSTCLLVCLLLIFADLASSASVEVKDESKNQSSERTTPNEPTATTVTVAIGATAATTTLKPSPQNDALKNNSTIEGGSPTGPAPIDAPNNATSQVQNKADVAKIDRSAEVKPADDANDATPQATTAKPASEGDTTSTLTTPTTQPSSTASSEKPQESPATVIDVIEPSNTTVSSTTPLATSSTEDVDGKTTKSSLAPEAATTATTSSEVTTQSSTEQPKPQTASENPSKASMSSTTIALVMAITFTTVVVCVYIGLVLWRRFLVYRYGNRELLVNDLEFDTNDLRHFEL